MCGSGPQTVTYKFKTQDRKIAVTDLATLLKWTKGALTRRRVIKAITIKEIQQLKYPTYEEQELVETELPLFSDSELMEMLDYEKGSKNLIWNNTFVAIGEGKEYQGQWHRDKYRQRYEGLGTIRYEDGGKYQGRTKRGQFDGKGRMTHANGDIYQGQWRDGKANGFGVYVDQQGHMYVGEWLNDQYHGEGCETWNYKQIKYEGNFIEAQKTGKGRFDFDGNYYEGDFVEDQFEGQGKYYFADCGKIYQGEFHENNIIGHGIMVWEDRTRYEGEFVNGKMDGKGIKHWPNGDRYEGLFQNDLQHGPGMFYSALENEESAEEWQEGERQIREEPADVNERSSVPSASEEGWVR